jgi:hypothetical protein
MAHALELPKDCEVLRKYPVMTLRNGPYQYEIRREGDRSIYSVTDGRQTISVPILWAFGYGVGGVGQTYLFKYRDHFYESEVSYYEQIHGLDITMGHQVRKPVVLEEALGPTLPWHDLWLCFGCHATAAVGGYLFRVQEMIPGIGCEGCHGPGTDHIAAVRSGHLENLQIFNPGTLPPDGLTDFCGSCHRTVLIEKFLGIRGVQNVRFQGYRLARSRCYTSGDRRLSCIVCHDPHGPLVRQGTFYDSKCLDCHPTKKPQNRKIDSGRLALPCPVAKRGCIDCHMPKLEVPGSHFKFTDHWIRIDKNDDKYPE